MSDKIENTTTALTLTERPIEIEKRFQAVISKPEILDRICEHVASGGSLVHLCKMWVLGYAKVMKWIKAQPGGEAKYKEALGLRDEWAQEMVQADLYLLAQSDIRDIFTDEGEIMNPKHLEDHIAPAVESIKIKKREIKGFEGADDELETTYEIQLASKLKVIDMLNRRQGKYVDKTEHSGSVNLVDIIAGSYKKDEPGGSKT